TLCNDPNKDFEILDSGSIRNNSESHKLTSSLFSRYSTSNLDRDISLYNSLYDLYFDTMALELSQDIDSTFDKEIS
ncbi:27492_t:CDS:2, partial [Racocetra persica]